MSITCLPKALRKFSLRGMSPRYFEVVLDGPAPAGLECFDFPLTISCEHALATYLPSSVTQLASVRGLTLDASKMIFFPNLSVLPLSSQFNFDVLQKLPPKLTGFHWSEVESFEEAQLRLPASLTRLESPVLPSLVSAILPLSLRHLGSINELDQSMPDHFWQMLPNLQSLQISFSHFSGPQAFQWLPPTLKVFGLYSNERLVSWIQRDDWTEWMPKQLEQIEISVDSPNLPISYWLSNLHHLPLLRHLSLITDALTPDFVDQDRQTQNQTEINPEGVYDSGEINPNAMDTDFQFRRPKNCQGPIVLPSGLRHFHLTTSYSYHLDYPQLLAQLPPNLQTLSLSHSESDSSQFIPADAFASLPASLTHLSCDFPLPPDFWYHIPATIQTINIPQTLDAKQNLLERAYFGSPIWLGCAKQRCYDHPNLFGHETPH
jgi:hypothetical protein